MKKYIRRSVPLVLATSLLLVSCSSSTLINSYPSGAQVYLNGNAVGKTPYNYSDTKIVGSVTNVRLEKEGFETYNASFERSEKADVGAIIGGLFVLVPFLWTMKYNPEHSYDLVPLTGTQTQTQGVKTNSGTLTKSKSEELRNLKNLLDEKVITAEEFEKEKKKILDN